MANRRGWMANFIIFLALVVASVVIITVFASLKLFLDVWLSSNIESEQKFVTPFLITYASSGLVYDEKDFFQELSYLSAGEPTFDDFENIVKERAGLMSNNYVISLYSNRLITVGLVTGVSTYNAVIPVFTFEKISDNLMVIT